jgi:hypothetical protein
MADRANKSGISSCGQQMVIEMTNDNARQPISLAMAGA